MAARKAVIAPKKSTEDTNNNNNVTPSPSLDSVPVMSGGSMVATNTMTTATTTTASVVEEAARVKLEKDMMVLADGIHLDNNTKNLLASFDARSVEDFFMMGESDFALLLKKANSQKRALPPLQIRKVRILREWLTQLVE
ncbi:MAG: hypothetical protein SGARI_003493, partial [Bacillariaceae sp.]